MGTRRWEIYLLVLKRSLTSERSDFQHEKIKFVSPNAHVDSVFYI